MFSRRLTQTFGPQYRDSCITVKPDSQSSLTLTGRQAHVLLPGIAGDNTVCCLQLASLHFWPDLNMRHTCL